MGCVTYPIGPRWPQPVDGAPTVAPESRYRQSLTKCWFEHHASVEDEAEVAGFRPR